MRNIKAQAETIQLSIYCNVIYQTLLHHKKLSIIKITTFSYMIKQNHFYGGTIYTARNKQDIIYKGISLLSGDFDGFCNSVPYILKALHLLIIKGIVKMESGILYLTNQRLKHVMVYDESRFIKEVIEKSKTLTDKQFMKEVIYNV